MAKQSASSTPSQSTASTGGKSPYVLGDNTRSKFGSFSEHPTTDIPTTTTSGSSGGFTPSNTTIAPSLVQLIASLAKKK
jgi:hypothetical protein